VLLFTQVFKQPLKGLVRGYYRITGNWDNPTVERIKSADAPRRSPNRSRTSPRRRWSSEYHSRHSNDLRPRGRGQSRRCAETASRGQGAGRRHRLSAENFSFIGLRDADKLAVAEADGDGPVQRFLSATAREAQLWILGGSTVIKGDDAQRVTNTSLLIERRRQRVARYDKIHLFDVAIPGRNEQYLESRHVAPGDAIVLADNAGRAARNVRLLRHALSRSCTANWWREARSGCRRRQRSPCRPGARTGKRCCARARSRICATWRRRRKAARTRADAKLMATR